MNTNSVVETEIYNGWLGNMTSHFEGHRVVGDCWCVLLSYIILYINQLDTLLLVKDNKELIFSQINYFNLIYIYLCVKK